jgi:hypothetical protein
LAARHFLRQLLREPVSGPVGREIDDQGRRIIGPVRVAIDVAGGFLHRWRKLRDVWRLRAFFQRDAEFDRDIPAVDLHGKRQRAMPIVQVDRTE